MQTYFEATSNKANMFFRLSTRSSLQPCPRGRIRAGHTRPPSACAARADVKKRLNNEL